MAQLIKLKNYISRYETDIYHYPGQFSRLKTENWKNMKSMWVNQQENKKIERGKEEESSEESNWRRLFSRKKDNDYEEEEQEQTYLPESELELKHYFLDKLLGFQLKWASTTISEMSFLDQGYKRDYLLKFFLQRIPDNYLLLYYPVFSLKNHLVDGEIIVISPLEVEVITIFEKTARKTIIANDERVWFTEENGIQSKVLSPVIPLKRTEKIIRSILNNQQLEFPIKRTVLSRKNDIEYKAEPYQMEYIGRGEYEEWLNQKQNLTSPLKHNQLKVANAILKYCETTAFRRPEWERETDKKEDNNRQNFYEF
ncbi:NERD domain-containing protein [Gracilibacillus oryzae]|uniref:NERD domain-containing protein n=1 Tax=Gracilibacillus oryzae TaxID=1672701 RepID=A0A7C8GUM9_9BACI|nr:NERD domain-containing protein [Gracilibacillus oryzae]KAB8138322.1 NERD domain-containing protein [Gracilibacillus oryzae]